MICIWRINKNIMEKTKSHFATREGFKVFWGAWLLLCAATTTDEYDGLWKELVALAPIVVSTYLEEIWLRSQKERFVCTSTNTLTQLGHATISGVEGSHSYPEQWIMVSTSDFLVVYGKMKLASESRLREVGKKIGAEMIRAPIHMH